MELRKRINIMNNSYNYQYLYQELNNRPYRIGLDLGVGSIGFAVVALNHMNEKTIPADLILEGSRIFTASIGAADRRVSRGQRNARRHNRHRKLWLWKILAEQGMMLNPPLHGHRVDHKKRCSFENTSTIMFEKETLSRCPYEIRYQALSEKIALTDLGYALYHLANHRGSSSIRINLEASEEDKQAQKSIQETQKFSSEHKEIKTFVELLFLNRKEHNTGFRNKNNRKNNLMPTRNLILNELEQICQTQQKFYPEIFTEEFITKLQYIVNYENEKMVPDAGFCPFFAQESKLPKCHFLNEERRLWEALNNTRIDGEPLEYKIKQQFFNILAQGSDLTESMVRKELKLDKFADITLQGRGKDKQKIVGLKGIELQSKRFWQRLSEEQQDQFFADWTHCADDERLLQLLQNKFFLTEEEALNALQTVSLTSDYAPIGKKAMLIVMEYIKSEDEPLSYQEAITKAIEDGKLTSDRKEKHYNLLPYYGEVLRDSTQPLIGKAWHSSLKEKFEKQSCRYVTPSTNKAEKTYGRIANPVVHQTLNELRKIVNEIITVLGTKPSEIGIELSRELKVGAEERDRISRNQNAQEAENKRIMNEYGVDEGFIIRFQLAEEQGFICPYCLQQFNRDNVASGSVDIDHIFPYSQSADNSRNNLVMTHKKCNQTDKGAKTPYQAFFGTEKWNEIEHFVKEQIPKKSWRFTLNNEQYQEWLTHRGFLSRFSTDTSYIAKAAAQYLQCLFEDISKHNVRTLKGGETATLRKAWGLHGLTHELGARFVEDKDGVYFHPAKKMRLDHRHHALDAIVIAYSTNGYTKLINTLSKKGFKLHGIQKMIPLPQITKVYQEESVDETSLGDKEKFIQYIKDRLNHHAHISLKYDHDKNGQLLKDTAYTILFEKNNQLVLVTKKKIDSLKDSIDEVNKSLRPKMYTEDKLGTYSEQEQIKLRKLLKYNESKREAIMAMMVEADKELHAQNEKLAAEGKREIKIDEKSITKRALSMVGGFYYQISNNESSKKFVKTKPRENQVGVAYDTGDNLRIDLYYDKSGKICGEIIRKVNAMQQSFIPEYKRNGFSCVESIYQGDTLEIDLVDFNNLNEKSNALEHVAAVKVPNAPQDRTFVRVATFTEIGKGQIVLYVQNLLKSKKGNDASFNLNSMQKWNVRRVILSPIGLIKYRSRILKYKE